MLRQPIGEAGRTATLIVAANNASDKSKAQADYVCDGIADEVQIQAAIDALPAVGGKVALTEGTFTTADYITAISNVTVAGTDTTVINGTINPSPANAGIFYANADISYFKLRNLRLNRLSGGTGGVLGLVGEPTYVFLGCGMYDCDSYSENSGCLPYSAGEGFEVRDSIFRASELVTGNGTEIGYAGKPKFYNCSFYSGIAPATSYGAYFSDNGGGVFTGCYFEGKTHGVNVGASANPRFIGCEFVSWDNVPVRVGTCAAPTFESCSIHPKIYSSRFTYQLVDEIPAIVSGQDYRIMTIHVRVDIAQVGETLDIGSTLGDDDIASAVDIGSTGLKSITPDRSVLFAADAPIYLTPSGALDNNCLRIFFSVAVDTNQASVVLQTTGDARFTNCYIYGTPHGVYFTENVPQLFNCVIECPDLARYTINYAASLVAYVKNCTLIGATRNVASYAYGPNSGTGSIASGTTSDVIAHGLGATPAAADISITLTENPTNSPGAIWVDTIGAANFTVNCENDPGASNLDFGWRAQVL